MNNTKQQSLDFDVVIIGSGPSGVQAALEAIKSGKKIALVDIGFIDTQIENLIPDKSFSEIRSTDKNQSLYFLGEKPETVFKNQAKAGVHLTPSRQHMIQKMEELFPLDSNTFCPLQSTGQGGLGISWGSNCFAFESHELKKIGLPAFEMKPFYNSVAENIGISGNVFDSIAPLIANLDQSYVQPPLSLDTNAESILNKYNKKKDKFSKNGFYLGQSMLAVLSKPLGNRKANSMHDMDFWSDQGASVYRPKYSIQELKNYSNFTYLSGCLVESFSEESDVVFLKYKNLKSNSYQTITAKRLILAAGAINSARIVLNSFSNMGTRVPILCNQNYWIAVLNLAMLGKAAEEKRYSLAQLTALLRMKEDPEDYVLAQFYSYRSLLLFRLLKDIPLPPSLGLLSLRLIINAFTCINVHYSDYPSSERYLELKNQNFTAQCSYSGIERKRTKQNQNNLMKQLVALGCIPLGITKPAHGASIHYAGTLPYSDIPKPFTCDETSKLFGTKSVFVADGSTWKYLPSKGLTLTLMANARRVAGFVVRDLHGK